MSLLDDAIGKAETLLQELKDASAQLAAGVEGHAETAAAAEAGHDNEQPFKCPACGKTYATQETCTNGHPAELTLPTADVLAGAEPGLEQPAAPPDAGAIGEAATTIPPAQTTPPVDGAPPPAGGAAADPSWPGSTT